MISLNIKCQLICCLRLTCSCRICLRFCQTFEQILTSQKEKSVIIIHLQNVKFNYSVIIIKMPLMVFELQIDISLTGIYLEVKGVLFEQY